MALGDVDGQAFDGGDRRPVVGPALTHEDDVAFLAVGPDGPRLECEILTGLARAGEGLEDPRAVLWVLVLQIGLGVRRGRTGRQTVEGEHLCGPPPGVRAPVVAEAAGEARGRRGARRGPRARPVRISHSRRGPSGPTARNATSSSWVSAGPTTGRRSPPSKAWPSTSPSAIRPAHRPTGRRRWRQKWVSCGRRWPAAPRSSRPRA